MAEKPGADGLCTKSSHRSLRTSLSLVFVMVFSAIHIACGASQQTSSQMVADTSDAIHSGTSSVANSGSSNLSIQRLPMSSAMAVEALVRGGGIERLADGSRAGSDTPYPVHQIVDVEVLRQSARRVLGSGATSDEFPPITNPQKVFGHALLGFVEPVPSFTGELLASIRVNEESAPEGSPPWQIGWVAQIADDGDVQIYEGSDDWDSQLAKLAELLQRPDQAALLVDWVTEALAEKEGAAEGPITAAYNAAFVPPEPEPEPRPSIEVPIFVRVEMAAVTAGDKVVVGVGWVDVEDDFVYPEDYEPEERLLSEGSGLMTGLVASGTMMRIELWLDGEPRAGTSLLPEQWEPIISGQAAGILITVSEESWITAEVLSQTEFDAFVRNASG